MIQFFHVSFAVIYSDAAFNISVINHLSLFEDDYSVAELANSIHLMADKENCFSAVSNTFHFLDAFFLETGVADCKNLINKQNIRLQVRCNGKSETDKHSAGISFYRCVNEFSYLRKLENIVKFFIYFCFGHSENRTVKINIFSAGQLVVKACTNLKHRGDFSIKFNLSVGRLGYS